MNQHEADMELAFAHARSKDKVCGICMEVVMVRYMVLHQRLIWRRYITNRNYPVFNTH